MHNQINKVLEFHRTYGRPVRETPTIIPADEFNLRVNLAREELTELIHAWANGDIVEVADAIVDQLYILLGTAIQMGLHKQLTYMFAEVHRSNMSKLDEDGRPIIREDGKILKGPNYFKPNLEQYL